MKTKNKAKTTLASNTPTLQISEEHLHASKRLLLDADNLSVHVGHEQILDSISLCVHAGEFIGVVGPNGAGKTTLLKAILGLIEPAKGTVLIRHGSYDYVPQRGSLYNAIVPMSVLDIVMLGSRGSKSLAMEALKSVRLEAFAHKRFSELSGGQQQRVTIAKALAGHADVLLLDEPTTGIDEHSQQEFYDILGALQRKGLTILMVSHEVDVVLKLVTRVICLNRSVLYDGAPEHFEADKYLPTIYKQQHIKLHHHHNGESS